LEMLTFGLFGSTSETPKVHTPTSLPPRHQSSAQDSDAVLHGRQTGNANTHQSLNEAEARQAYSQRQGDAANGARMLSSSMLPSHPNQSVPTVGRNGRLYARGSLANITTSSQVSESGLPTRRAPAHTTATLLAGSRGSIQFPPISSSHLSHDTTTHHHPRSTQRSLPSNVSTLSTERDDLRRSNTPPLTPVTNNVHKERINVLERTKSLPVASISQPSSTPVLCCDKCDGKHETDQCPYFKKSRDTHPDAQKNFYKKLGGTSVLPGSTLRMARTVRQPGDGSCLFHSMSYGLRNCNAQTLRAEICSFISRNPNFLICETPLSDWVKWDSGLTTVEYARRMSGGQWGGGIEMAVCSMLKACNVHVYERSGLGYKRISAFDYHTSPEDKTIVRVVYQGGVHYDALVTAL
jgi:hypothetical protein